MRALSGLAFLLLAAACGFPGTTRAQAPERRVDGALIIHYWPGGRPLADRLAERARALPPLPALPAGIVADPDRPVDVFLAPDPARFDSLTHGLAPEWGAGVAFPADGVIVLPGFLSERAAPHELGRILRHELAHVALRRHLEPARPPRWFDEGFARWAAGEWDWETAWRLRLAFAFNRAPDLDSLDLDWPDAEADARIAYLLAASTVAFLADRSGERGLRLFLDRWRDAGDLEPALRQTYGLTLSQFEEDWRADVRRRYGWALLASHSLVFWLGIAILLLLFAARRRRRDLDRLDRLRATDPPDAPAYWLEGPAAADDPAPAEPDDLDGGRDSR